MAAAANFQNFAGNKRESTAIARDNLKAVFHPCIWSNQNIMFDDTTDVRTIFWIELFPYILSHTNV